MTLESFIQSVLDKAIEIFAEQKSIEPMLFVEAGESCIIIPSGFFVASAQNKAILAWLPAYIGLLSAPIKRCVFVSEFSMLKCTEAGVAEAMLEKYGSVLGMPSDITEDNVVLSVNDGTNDTCLALPVIKNEKGEPERLAEPMLSQSVSGLFFDFMQNANLLKTSFDSITAGLGVVAPLSPEKQLSLLGMVSRVIAAKTGDNAHLSALDIASTIVSQLRAQGATTPLATTENGTVH